MFRQAHQFLPGCTQSAADRDCREHWKAEFSERKYTALELFDNAVALRDLSVTFRQMLRPVLNAKGRTVILVAARNFICVM